MRTLTLSIAIATASMMYLCLSLNIPQQGSAIALAVINGILCLSSLVAFVTNK